MTHKRIADIARLAADVVFDAHLDEDYDMPDAASAHAFLADWAAHDMPDDRWEDDLVEAKGPRWWQYFESNYNRAIANLERANGRKVMKAMTHKRIAEIAREAAQNAFDAHQAIGHMPSAQIAAEFTAQCALDRDDLDDAAADAEYRAIMEAAHHPYFAFVYGRRLQNLERAQ